MAIPPIPPIPPIKDHTKLTNIGTKTHNQIDTHIAAANPHADSLNKTGDTMSGDLAFSTGKRLIVGGDEYAFKYSGNYAGLFFNLATSQFEYLNGTSSRLSSVHAVSGVFYSTAFKQLKAQFDKTNTTFAAITGFSVTLKAGLSYRFRAVLFIDASAVGGSKYEMAATGGLTATSIIYNINLLDNATSAYTITSRQTAMAGAAGQAGTTAGLCIIEGSITVNVAGNLAVAFAQNAANGTSSVLLGSTYEVMEIV